MRQVPDYLIHETRIVTERVGHILQVLLRLVVPADANTVVADEEVKFENELKDLVHCDLKSIVS